MSNLRNTATVIGNVGKDPVITNFEQGKKVASFNVATKETYVNSNGDKVENTQWHRISAWGKKADIIEKYVSKGDKVGIEGKMVTQIVEKNGTTYYNTIIEARQIELLTPKK